MTQDFFRFPHTPHLAWLGAGMPRDDKVLSPSEVQAFLEGEVVVEEKLDGANIGLSVGPEGELRAQNRGQYLCGPYSGQFEHLTKWMDVHEDALFDASSDGNILFGEWCAARHSVSYDRLPDWFLVFDVYDRANNRFWSTPRRNSLAHGLGLSTVPTLLTGRTSLADLQVLVRSESSQFRAGPMEGIVIRQESQQWLTRRAKIVSPGFVQSIQEHWRRRRIEWNKLLFPEVARQLRAAKR
jgi:ATP-dependent RNA circularization protein (DNA/RNA ligase family)